MFNSNILIRSKSDNSYLISNSAKGLLLIHPILSFIINKFNEGIDIPGWLDGIDGEAICINDNLKAEKKDIYYYYNYFLFLKENGYLGKIDKFPLCDKKITGQMVRDFFINSDQICFEVTESCLLNCKYCGYGDLYNRFGDRKGYDLSFKSAKKLIDHFFDKRHSRFLKRMFKAITISFYGGEPLLNFPLIYKLVEYLNNKKRKNIAIKYQITTNGILIDNYIDFLVKNDFNINISLDGNKVHNGFRVYKNGSQSFDDVICNVEMLSNNYPDYFKKKVNFISVIHTKNSLNEVYDFFKNSFGKKPRVSELSKIGINPNKIEEFNRLHRNVAVDLGEIFTYNQSNGSLQKNKHLSKLYLYSFLLSFTNNIIRSYSQLISNQKNRMFINTGTCRPFKQKIFCTAQGYLLPCEKIPKKYALGKVDDQKVFIDYQKVADKYNNWYKKLSKMCDQCYIGPICTKCMFFLNLDSELISCEEYCTYESYIDFLKNVVSTFESQPDFYLKLLTNNK